MKHKKNKRRFKVIYEQNEGDGSGFKIFEDTYTGLSYLYAYGPAQGGLTVLLDEEGHPAVVPDNY